MPIYGEKFERALVYVAQKHGSQVRKGDAGIPYVTHLMAVAALVGEAGGSEDEVVAALLHDVMEDQGVSAEEIRSRFGDPVEAIVAGCSDGTPGDARDKTDWRRRKQAYLDHLRSERNASVLLVSCADKLHNVRALLADLREHGPVVWQRFNAGRDEQLWYYEGLVAAFEAGATSTRLLRELQHSVKDLQGLIASHGLNVR